MDSDLVRKAADFQATENIIMLGHVANGKSTLVQKMTSIKTQRFKSEIAGGGRTHHMGYANIKLFKHPDKDDIDSYVFVNSNETKYVDDKGEEYDLLHHISFSDPPGHNELLGEMLNGTTSIKNCKAIIVLGGNNKTIPSAQTVEHIVAMKLLGIVPIAVVFNKVDIVRKKKKVMEKYKMWMEFAKKFNLENVPVIPISAALGLNIDYLAYFLGNVLKPRDRETDKPVMMVAMRSWNINKNGIDPRTMKGGTFGGSIQRGTLKVGERVCIRPGLIFRTPDKETDWGYCPLETDVLSMKSESIFIKSAIPGGLVGVSTKLDSALTQHDGIVGSVMVPVGTDEDDDLGVYEKLKLEMEYSRHYEYLSNDVELDEFDIKEEDKVVINSNSSSVQAIVEKKDEDTLTLKLMRPVVSSIGGKVAVSKDTASHGIRLLGSGKVLEGGKCFLDKSKI